MAGAVVYEEDLQRTQPTTDALFAGQKLWFSHTVPQRQWLIQNAELNGAQIVQLDKQADVRIVDHAKKNPPPESHSYRYVELSIRNGSLEDLDAHRVGITSRVERPVGSIITASKGGRNKFTLADDQLLWNWVKPYMDAGGAWKGNEIYKQLERINPNHTFQSWRDRWIKHTQYRPHEITEDTGSAVFQTSAQAENVQPSPKRRKLAPQATPSGSLHTVASATQRLETGRQSPQSSRRRIAKTLPLVLGQATDHGASPVQQEDVPQQISTSPLPAPIQPAALRIDQATVGHQDQVQVQEQVPRANHGRSKADMDKEENTVDADRNRLPLAFNFTQSEARMLYNAACHILRAREEKLDESWAAVAREYPGHTKEKWMNFFYKFIAPEYKRRHGIMTDEQLEQHLVMRAARRKSAKQGAEQVGGDELSSSSDSEVEEEKEEEEDKCIVCEKLVAMPRLRRYIKGKGVCIDCLECLTSGDKVLKQSNAPHMPRGDETQNHAPTSTIDPIARQDARAEPAASSELPTPGPNTDPVASVSAWFRPPRPNESRKLSQVRGSQSTQSQTQSQSYSNSNSQPSQRSHPLLSTRDGLSSLNAAYSAQEHEISNEQTHAQRNLSNSISDPIRSQEHDESADRFVTQLSGHGHTADPESDKTSPVKQTEDLVQLEEGTDPESLLFVPEQDDEHSSTSSHEDLAEDGFSEQLDSQPVVQLVEDDHTVPEAERSSGYSPSEAASEAVQFDSQAQLSHAWETAPEENAMGSHEGSEADDEDEGTEEALSSEHNVATRPQQQMTQPPALHDESEIHSHTAHDQSPSSISIRDRSKTVEFETAPTHVNTNLALPQPSSRLDTQALFNQPTEANFTQLATIPEPLGGWDDEGDLAHGGRVQVDTQNIKPTSSLHSTPPHHNPDWTLPLPDPESASTSNANPHTTSQANNDSENEIDSWLQAQASTNPHVPKYLLKPLSYRALESSSMDPTLASKVFARMLRALDLDLDNAKGKRPASSMSRAVQDLRSLPRADRAMAVTSLIEQVVPQDMSGCWTKDDDAALLGVSGRGVKRVEDKHGERGVSKRFDFLELWYKN